MCAKVRPHGSVRGAARKGGSYRDNHEMIPGTEEIELEPGIDLSSWNTGPYNLRYGDFSGVDLSNSDFSFSWLDNARFAETDLTNANLTEANLTGANLTDADLSSSTLTQANLASTDLSSSTLTRPT